MSGKSGLLFAFDIEPSGRGTELGWDDLDSPIEGGYRWIHLELEAERAQAWLRERSGLDELQCEALLADETRPRSTPMGDGLLLILRGVNHNPGADPEDMVAMRLWADAKRVITFRRRHLLAIQEVHASVLAGRGADSVGDFVAELADRLVEPVAEVLADLEDGLDAIEAREVAEGDESPGPPRALRASLIDLRRQSITLRRYLSPQRDALARLTSERLPWLQDRERLHLREVLDRTTRYVEDLEAARERAVVSQEELATRLSEQLNRRMYALSIVAGVFLPLSFATGLLGINVGGIPGAATDWAFFAVCAALGALAVGEVVLFRRLGWL